MPDITITVSDEVAERLSALIDPEWGLSDLAAVIGKLVDHAQQGVYRPGAWEHEWIKQAFGYSWLERMEPDDRPEMLSGDGRVIFDRPRRGEEGG